MTVSSPARSQVRTERLGVLDVLRGVAILAMLIAHGVPFLWPTGVSRPLEMILGAINAVASPLFGLAMGAAAALVWARPATIRTWPRRVLTDVARGVVIFAIGMLLVELDTWVAIVLQVLGVLMIIGLPVAALAGAGMRPGPRTDRLRWVLLAVTLSLFLLAPWVTGTVAPAPDRLANGTTGGLAELWAALVAGWSYRAVSLLPFFALGAVLAASGLLRRPRTLFGWAAPAALALVALRLVGALRPAELSGGFMDQWWDLTLVVLAVAGVSGIVGFGGAALRSTWRSVADLGAIALSVYALQLLVLRPLMDWGAWRDSSALAWVSMVALVLIPSALMVGWRRILGPGPLERLVALVTGKGRAT